MVILSYGYILISPVKDEEKDLPAVINSVIHQTSLPMLWIIIDDGSTDKTPEIIKNFREKYDWIKSTRLPEHPRDIDLHYAYVCRKGFEIAIKYCEENNVFYDFIGLLDGDTILEEKFFEKLIEEFRCDSLLGIGSGGIYYSTNNGLLWEKTYENFPRGTGRLWTKKCFFDTGGYALDPAMHSISNIKATLRGYRTKQFKNIIAIQTRKTSSAEGLWNGYIRNGKAAYYLYRRPIMVLLNAINSTVKYPFYCGSAYLIGYLSAFIKREPRIQDSEIKSYFQKQKLSEVLGIRKNLENKVHE